VPSDMQSRIGADLIRALKLMPLPLLESMQCIPCTCSCGAGVGGGGGWGVCAHYDDAAHCGSSIWFPYKASREHGCWLQ
jgi:hypothetical protein